MKRFVHNKRGSHTQHRRRRRRCIGKWVKIFRFKFIPKPKNSSLLPITREIFDELDNIQLERKGEEEKHMENEKYTINQMPKFPKSMKVKLTVYVFNKPKNIHTQDRDILNRMHKRIPSFLQKSE